MEVAKENYSDSTVKVSVAIPCYNHGAFLKEAIQSVLESTFDHYEIIIVNDGSTDAFTMKVFVELGKKFANDQRIKIMHQENLGTSDARNNAIKIAKGEYILPLDADNKIRPHYLTKAVEILDKNPEVGVVYAYANFFGEKEGIWEFPEFDEQRLLVGNFIDACSVFRKRVWEECNGYDPDMRIGYEDWDLWISALENGWKFHLIKEVLFDYRFLSNSRVSSCNIPENRRPLIKYICHKHKDTYIENLDYVISEKDVAVLHANNHASNLEHHARNLEAQIQAKDVHIRDIESELSLIKRYRVWAIADVFRRLFYIKLSGKFSLLQKAMLTISREGFRAFFAKTRDYIKRNKNVVTLGVGQRDYDKWMNKNRLTEERIKIIKKEIAGFQYKPKISIIMPVYNVEQIWLEKAIDSVINQLYDNWELCIADDASTKKHIKRTLRRYSQRDRRIKVKFLRENQGIALASNEVISLATSEFIGLLDHDDELSIDALYENVKLLNRYPSAGLIYSDEDKIDIKGNRIEPFFKPDYSSDLILSQNYICHFTLLKKSLFEDIGGFREGYDGSQDHDLVLRIVEKTDEVYHIPKILYHWRKIPGSTAAVYDSKSYAWEAGRRAVEDALKRRKIEGKAFLGKFQGSYRVKRKILGKPLVSIIIPFKGKPKLLKLCIDSMLEKTTYSSFEILGINNNSSDSKSFELIKYYLKIDKRIRFHDYNFPFNFSKINNYAATMARGEHVVLLNNDIEIITPDWIEALLEHSQRPEVGAVGAKLYYSGDRVQHAGIIIGITGVAGHPHRFFHKSEVGYYARPHIIHNVSVVTGALMMVKKMIYKEMEGLNEKSLGIAYNDVDFCLRLRDKGYLNVFTPYCEAFHHESASRGYEDTKQKVERFGKEQHYIRTRHETIFKTGDPYYNPNLTIDREDFSIRI